MPPSRDTVWGEQSVSEEEFSDNWKRAFGKTTHRKEIHGMCECTCNYREVRVLNKLFIENDNCVIHNRIANKMEVKAYVAIPKFSKRHMKKVREYVLYGNQTLTDVMDRNS